MRTSLVRLPYRPAIFQRGTTGSTHARCRTYKIEERGRQVKAGFDNAVHMRLRKVRFGKGNEADIKKDEARARQGKLRDEQLDKLQKKAGQKFTRKYERPTHGLKLAYQFQNVELDRTRRVDGLSLKRKDGDLTPLPFIDSIAETPDKGNDAITDRDKWGKSPEIWLDLLQKEARTKGHTGIEQVWALMREAYVELPVKGAKAGQFWTILLSNPVLHHEVVNYAIGLRIRKQKAFPPLYTLILRHVLRTRAPEETLRWHRRLSENYIVPRDALKMLAIPASMSDSNHGLEAFRIIYEDLREKCEPIYDQLIPALLKTGRFRHALRWHSVLEKHNDLPSAEASKLEMVQTFQHLRQSVLQKRGAWHRRKRVRDLERAANVSGSFSTADALIKGVAMQEQSPNLDPKSAAITGPGIFTAPMSTESSKPIELKMAASPISPAAKRGLFSSLFAEVQGAGQDGFSDEFCARLYATKAITPSWVTSFLHAFNVKKIGALALRELALRSGSTEDLQYYIAELKDSGISLASTTFCRAVKKLAEDGQAELLRGLLQLDDHPDNLDDVHLRHEVLDEAINRGDRVQAHQLLTLLSMFTDDPKQEYMNSLLRSHIRRRHIPDVLRFADEMQLEGVKITQGTMKTVIHRLLRPRAVGRRPNMLDREFQYDDLRIVTNLAIRTLEGGTELPEWLWVELFKRHGMKNLDSLERFCHATLNAYQSIRTKVAYDERARKTGSISIHLTGQVRRPDDHVLRSSLPFGSAANPLHYLLTPRRLQYIVAWGFHEGLRRLAIVQDRHWRHGTARGRKGTMRYRRWPAFLAPPPPDKTFLSGIDVVQRLQEKGVLVNTAAIESVIKERLWALFGPGKSHRRKNVTVMALNPYGIVEMLKAVEKMWRGPKPLFQDVKHLMQPLPTGHSPPANAQVEAPIKEDRPFTSKLDADYSTELESDQLFSTSQHVHAQSDNTEGSNTGSLESELVPLMPISSDQVTNPMEMQLRRDTEALMKIFWDRRTVGFRDKRNQRKMLGREQWAELMHQWARMAAMKRFDARAASEVKEAAYHAV
jgi:hypothetical protein